MTRRMSRAVVCAVVGLVFSIAGCRTDFRGSATFNGGPTACFRRCADEGMVMSSFVYMGEYSTGCVCGLRRTDGTAGGEVADGAETGGSGMAAAGVWMQMRREGESRR